MMWDDVMTRVLALLDTNATLHDLFGGKMRMVSEGSKLEVPSLEYTILTDTNAELFEPMLVQIDLWTLRADQNRLAERIVRNLLDQRTSVRWTDVVALSEFTDGAFLSTPDRAGFIGRGLRFRFTPLKQQYAQPAH